MADIRFSLQLEGVDENDRLDFARDLPTTVEDTEALRRATTVGQLDIEIYRRDLCDGKRNRSVP
jgi:hypothetical protein